MKEEQATGHQRVANLRCPRGESSDDYNHKSWSVSRREWTLFWRDRNHRWHRYKYTAPTTEIARLLEEIDRDPTGIFWG